MTNHLLFLLLALRALPIWADVLPFLIDPVSIDCGSSKFYTDENLISWVGDDDYIQSGEPKTVQSSKTMPQVMTTLRVFPTRNKNCYSIDAEEGEQVLVRASFFYGNYDKKSSPPIFDLQFDGNHWVTVVTSTDQVVSHEAIYVTKKDTISVCVAQLFSDVLPFISAIEVRSLSLNMYSNVNSNHALILRRRVAYGVKETVRYPQDTYDRIWLPAINAAGFTELSSDALFIEITQNDRPPRAVLQNAFTVSKTSTSIDFTTNLPSIKVPIYMNMYFSEVAELDITQKRSFEIYVNNVAVSDPIIPPFGKALEVYMSNVTASSNTSFSLLATADSTLPPLINALEVYTITDPLTDGTHSSDVEGLAELQSVSDVLNEWQGDPCLPAPYVWDWINCSADATPRVTALYLSSFDLSGTLPDLSSMTALETIDLHNNSLDGSIPEFLGTLPNLKLLNLADNKFSGPIPSSISKNTKLKLVVSGNPAVCATGKSCKTIKTGSKDPSISSSGDSKNKSNKLPLILGVTIPAFVLIWAIVGFCIILHQKRKSAAVVDNSAGPNSGLKMANGTVPVQGPGATMNLQMVGSAGQAAMNELMVNFQEQPSMEAAEHHPGSSTRHEAQHEHEEI